MATHFSSYPLTASAFSAGFAVLKNLTINTVGELDASLSETIDTRFTNQAKVSVVTAAAPAATAVGNTPGSFSVSPSGAATYSIPIAVPPGAAGMQPSLSLAYSSQSGNGLVGVGFSLQGLSAITRCPQTYATDGNSGGVNGDTNDRYCLDGQRLIAINTALAYNADGQEYRTEIDSFTQIIAHGAAGTGPSYFTARTKSGQTIQYGFTPDAQILISSSGATAMVWAANQVTDTVGNYQTIKYCQSGGGSYCSGNSVGNPSPLAGEFYPTRIDYSGNSSTPTSSSVQFTYATRTDTSIGYMGGSQINNSVRLTNVKTYEGTSLIRDYRLSYDTATRSRVSSLTECDGGNKCLPATAFSWTSGSVAGFSTTNTSTGIASSAQYTKAMDVNGDGKTDLVYCASATDTWKIAISNGTGFNTPIPTIFTCTNYQYATPIDYDSDGKQDLMVANSDGKWYVLRSTGSGFSATPTGLPNSGYQKNPQAIDVNGDGRTDFVQDYNWIYHISFNSASGLTTEVGTSASTNYNSPSYNYMSSTAQPLDYIGDGKTDLLAACGMGHWHLLQSNGGDFGDVWNIANTGTYVTTSSVLYPTLVDINGDGRPDLVYSNGSMWKIRLNTGVSFSSTEENPPTNIPVSNAQYAKPVDYNGDGRMDLMIPGPLGGTYTASKWYVLQSTGSGFTVINTQLPISGYTNYPLLADIDGDGAPDLLTYYSTVTPAEAANWHIRLHNAGAPDQLTTITSGLGTQTAITYKQLTDNSIYAKANTTATFPQQDFQGPMYVVSQYTTSDGVGGTYLTSYAYKGARIDAQGRGFLGFSNVIATHTRPDNTVETTETNYSQTWPYIGMVTTAKKTVKGATVSDVANTFDNIQTGSINFPYVKQTSARAYELYGSTSSLITTTTTITYYKSTTLYPAPPTECAGAQEDSYGNPTCIQVRTSDGTQTYIKTTVNTYDTPNTTSWILGRLINAKVTSTLPPPSGLSLTRESSFTYYSNTGLLWTEVVEPNKNTATDKSLKQTTTYTYDNFGNKKDVTVTGEDGISRPASAASNASTAGAPYAYSAGRFETNLTNAAIQGETRVYDARYGTVATLTGPNSLSTNWTYDGFGRKSTETRADGTSTNWSYNFCGNCPDHARYYVIQTTTGAPTVTVYYDRLDREVRTETQGYNGVSIYKDTVYNNLGQVAKVSRPYYVGDTSYWTFFGYDDLGRVKTVSLPTSSTSAGTTLATTSYNGLSTTVTQTRNDGQTTTLLPTTKIKDALGQLVQVTDANGKPTTYDYDPFGNLLRVTDPVGNKSEMTYDIRGRKLTMSDPDMGNWQYAYNSVGDLTWQKDAKGQQVWMYYDDPLGRMTKRTDDVDGDTTWIYDSATISGAFAKGKLSKVTWPGGDSRAYTYDSFGRPSTETTTLSGTAFTITSTYDSASRLDKLTYPSGFTVRNNYGTFGYLSSVTNTGQTKNYWTAPAYNAAGQTTAFTLGNGLTTVNQYDPATGLITGISTGSGAGSTTQYLTYTYDTLGNLSKRVDGNQANLTESFGYDNLNRLTSANIAGVGSKSVTYDPAGIGNINSKSDLGAAAWTYDPLHVHAVKSTPLGNYTYDANGNQLTGPNGRNISYNSYNQPTSITVNGKTDRFTYDGDHQRLTQTLADGSVEIYIHPRIDLGAHYEQVTHPPVNGVTTTEYQSYIYAGKENIGVYTTTVTGTTSTNNTKYFHKDHLGSIDTITNGTTGSVNQRLSYDAWGKRRNGNWTDATTTITALTHHGFTGHEMLDDVGLITMNARIYDPTLGRFIQADPTVQSPGNPQTLNRYSYAGNNPLTYTDPSGYSIWGSLVKIFEVAVAIVAVVVAMYVLGPYAALQMGLVHGTAAFAVASGIIGGAIGGFAAGYIGSGGNMQAAWSGAVSGAVFGGIGGYGDAAHWGYGGFGERTLAHAVGGGITGRLQGQKFMSGFVSAGASEWVGLGQPTGKEDFAYNMAASAVIGGTASAIGGGKFENGAKTSAYAYMFNEAATVALGLVVCPRQAPSAPPGVSLDSNIEQAKQHYGDLVWFDNQVKSGGPWDYKHWYGEQYANFGNYNYGATGSALGVPDQVLLRAAGWYQEFKTPMTYSSTFGHFYGSAPYGDDPKDQAYIKMGFQYYDDYSRH